ncbi:Cell division GTPase FtsZ [Halogranum amylolyticum]|uniref:Cell division GTPase FtsZ n=1 Tax=Halogranum amylolyticum TaxID=660520 RepID=A0A1H8P8J8_9EURY|nr:hypothetical protein [Halogranum amylolyticum]SEO38245.1 Cell division GTPase FtsZ [Halogranum amylolyticum]
MQLALIGVGRVGGAVVDSLAAYDRLFDGGVVAGTVAVDTAPADLASLRAVSRPARVVVGAAYPCRDGVDGDNELGASIVAEDIDRVLAGVDYLPSHHVDAFLVVAALGGGIGGGGAPVLARELRRLFERPVYGLGVLPGVDADDATARRSVRSLVTFVREVDNLLLVTGDDQQGQIDVTELARRVVAVFGTDRSAHAVFGGRPPGPSRTPDGTDERSDANTAHDERDGDVPPGSDDGDAVTLETVLEAGTLSTLGYAVAPPRQPRLVDRIRQLLRQPTAGEANDDFVRTVRAAATGGTGGDVSRAAGAWVVVAGPRRTLSRSERGVDRGREWLRSATGADAVGGRTVITEDGPLTATVVLSGVRVVRQLTRLWEQAVATGSRDGRDRRSSEPPNWQDRTFDPLF